MDQELFEHVRTFLEKQKNCTNVEYQVPLTVKSYNQNIGKMRGLPSAKLGRIPIVGGTLYKYAQNPNEVNPTEYTGLELHCIAYKDKQTSDGGFVQDIGDLMWAKFIMSTEDIWCDRLFLYIMIDEEKGSKEQQEFCKRFGLGLIHIQAYKIVTEVISPLNQHGMLSSRAQELVRIGCEKCPFPPAPLTSKDIICPHCSTSSITLKVDPLPLAADAFLHSSTNQKFKGAPKRMPDELQATPMLVKVFRNWDSVKANWNKTSIRSWD